MDQQQIDRGSGASEAAGAGRPRPGAGFYYLHPLLAGPLRDWPALLDRIAALGFGQIVLAPPFAGPSLLLAGDFETIHPSLAWDGDAQGALRFIDTSCRASGLGWLLDVVLDRVAPEGAIAREAPDVFSPPPRDRIDPRRGEPAALARFDTAPEEVAEWWAARLRAWTQTGAGGFRLLGLAATPPAILRAITAEGGGGLMIGWTEGLASPALADLAGCGLDRTTLCLDGWDFSGDWLWARLEECERAAPALACVAAPFGPRAAARVDDGRWLARLAETAAALGSGWMVPMGFENGATIPLDPRRAVPGDLDGGHDLRPILAAANASAAFETDVRPVIAPGLGATAFARGKRALVLVNPELTTPRTVDPAAAAARLGYVAPDELTLRPGEVRTLPLTPVRAVLRDRGALRETAVRAAREPRIAIERLTPDVDAGRFAAKRCVGDTVTVEADIICDGHDQLGVVLQWRAADQPDWSEARMVLLGNDRWRGHFPLTRLGPWEFRVQAWRDAFATFRDELAKKTAAGIDVHLETAEGRVLVAEAAERSPAVAEALAELDARDAAGRVELLLSTELAARMAAADPRPFGVTSDDRCVEADRPLARFAAWYEIFPRSMSDDESRHGTFDDVIRHLPRIRDMGFDVLYFPPISPIGHTNRKGRNNSLRAGPDDPGSPYAIGSEEGGHDAIHPQLGTLEDFRRLIAVAAEHGLEIALDFAIQCSPDHPWLEQHKRWFDWRPDGSLRYAENPPKKYEDIVNVDFYGAEAIPGLWVALCEVVLFWARQGVRIFRVDNPHTKPLPFWEWLIGEVRAAHPGTIFLSEAFTRPKMMYRLAKLGFTQSYTYFTWRNTKRELTEYLTELADGEPREFFRPNFFVNTPDINPPFLQTSGRAGFLIRAALATTLSGLWGMYCGFELCEARPLPGREEYLDSEKYQLRAWDWQRPGNIIAEIARLNHIRRLNPALQTHLGVTFLAADNDQVLFFEKATPGRDNVVLVAINLDPHHAQSAAIELPLWRWGLPDHATLACEDLLHGGHFTLTSKWQRVTLTPDAPYTFWRAHPAA